MMRFVAEAWVAVRASWRIFTFRPDWKSGFDISMAGFWRSFGAILFAVPMIAMIHVSGEAIGRDLSWRDEFLIQGVSWVLFPVAAALAAQVTGARAGFVRWIIVHNWAVLWLYAYLFVLWTLFTAGILPVELMSIGIFIYPYLRVLAHWRIAYVSLGLPTITSALAAAVPILATEIAVRIYFTSVIAPQASGG
ncbi:MAG: hypothetical protein VX529_00090 [Pseudomonadota bacterium]|jgi:hypothetical protein|nr:hypothetical protein [Pseudomonadota bacterium]